VHSFTVFLLRDLISDAYMKGVSNCSVQFSADTASLSLNLAKNILVKSYAVYRTLQWASVSPDLETTAPGF
jgi:hypothetical protein